MKFAHISDTHIRNLKYHREYRAVFQEIYKTLREEKIDYIVHCGDIAHTKTQISPEFVEMATDFLKNLADIAPTYVILGNHDGNLKNGGRQDAISPIVKALGHKDLHLLKNSGETDIGNNFSLNVLSVFDRDNWVSPSDDEKINIALYHGAIAGVMTDKNYMLEHGEDNLEIFAEHDFAFLGDIHKTNQILDPEGRCRYSGSTVQQNFGETNDKGFLIWEIENKDTFSARHIVIDNPSPFISVILTEEGRIPDDVSVPVGSRLRLIAESHLGISQFQRAMEAAKTRFRPESISYLNRADQSSFTSENSSSYKKMDLRDPKIQRNLIEEYLAEHKVDEEVLKKVYDLNDRYNATTASAIESASRNTNWKLKSMEWSNLFNYGEDNYCDFESLGGIVGIFGKNYSGKSSIIDSLLWLIFNTTSKNDRKNLNVINQNKEECWGEVTIDVGNKTYKIYRKASKYIKKLKGEVTTEAKTEINFEYLDGITGETVSLNGMTVNETNQNIRNVFGDIEDFLMTSMASQLDSLSFIGEGSKRRKEILTKFLDLEAFDKKYQAAKSDSSDTKAILRKLEGEDYLVKIASTEIEFEKNFSDTDAAKKVLSSKEKEYSIVSEEVSHLTGKIDSVPHESISYEDEVANVSALQSMIGKKNEKIKKLEADVISYVNQVANAEKVINEFNIAEINEKKEICTKLKEDLSLVQSQILLREQEGVNKTKKLKLLDEVPCGSEYSHCKFIKDAYDAKTELKAINSAISNLLSEKRGYEGKIEELDEEKITETLKRYEFIKIKIPELKTKLAESRLEIGNIEKSICEDEEKIVRSQEKIKTYEENREAIENLQALKKTLSMKRREADSKKQEIEEQKSVVLDLVKKNGSLESTLNSLLEKQEEVERMRDEFLAYDLFMQCMHSNGISSDIVRNQLPLINEEIAKILTNVVDFDIYVESEDKRLEIFIRHPKFDPRPIEMGSGAEKTIAAMAIRLALLSVSSMPKADIIILDEPGTALDEDNMQGFVTILDIIKNYFKTVVLISHLDSLKDCVDQQIVIDKNDGYAKVNN